VASQAEFAYAFDVLVGDCKSSPKERVFGRDRHDAGLPGQERIGIPVVSSSMAHATLLHLDKFDVGLLRLHTGEKYFRMDAADYCQNQPKNQVLATIVHCLVLLLYSNIGYTTLCCSRVLRYFFVGGWFSEKQSPCSTRKPRQIMWINCENQSIVFERE
jgi:hypothetical protein